MSANKAGGVVRNFGRWDGGGGNNAKPSIMLMDIERKCNALLRSGEVWDCHGRKLAMAANLPWPQTCHGRKIVVDNDSNTADYSDTFEASPCAFASSLFLIVF